MLRLRNLSTSYGRIRALHGVSLHVQEGEIVALIGANGAGKTTLLNSISKVVAPAEGSILFLREEISRLRPEEIVRRGLCQVPEGRQIFSRLTVAENLELGAYLRYRLESKSALRQEQEKILERFPALKPRLRQLAGTLSGGEQQMLAIARALMSKPRLLLLDEPSMGLAPRLVTEIINIITELNRDGVTILLVEQNARAALAIARRAYVMEIGRVVLEGDAKSLARDPEVKRAYLGRDYGEIWER